MSTPEDKAKSDLRALAEAYKEATGTSVSAVGREAVKDGSFFGRLAETGLTFKKYGAMVEWFSAHWPADTPWPDDIVRPVASPPTAPDSPAPESERTS